MHFATTELTQLFIRPSVRSNPVLIEFCDSFKNLASIGNFLPLA